MRANGQTTTDVDGVQRLQGVEGRQVNVKGRQGDRKEVRVISPKTYRDHDSDRRNYGK